MQWHVTNNENTLKHAVTWEYLQENCHYNEGVRVGEVLDKFQETFTKVTQHQNFKQIQAAKFENDLKDQSFRILQIDHAMAYQCELQKETMGPLWTRGSVSLLTCAIYHKSITKTMLFCTNYKGKDKFSTRLYLNRL